MCTFMGVMACIQAGALAAAQGEDVRVDADGAACVVTQTGWRALRRWATRPSALGMRCGKARWRLTIAI